MIDKKRQEQISNWIDSHRDDLEQDIVRVAKIKSVSQHESDTPPYGKGCQQVLREMLEIGKEHGFITRNYENHVGSLCFQEDKPENTIGFWGHLDVVPEGDGWDYEPYGATRQDGYIIGRGTNDNKGPTVAVMYLIKCLKELNIPMRHSLKLFVGCDEEQGMADLDYYTAHYPCPAISLVADAGFPVCYGEKGILEVRLVSQDEISPLVLSFSGGIASNVVPDYAQITLKDTSETRYLMEVLQHRTPSVETRCQDGTIQIIARGTAKHAAGPDGGVNAIFVLTSALADTGMIPYPENQILQFLNQVNGDFTGNGLGIACSDGLSGSLTCVGSMLGMRDRHITLSYNIRYPILANAQKMLAVMEGICKTGRFSLELIRDSQPNYFSKDHPAVEVLTNVYNEYMNLDTKPYVMGGGTYARKLPNAFAYGMGLPKEEDPNRLAFREGHGGAHSPDEALDVNALIKAMKIYAAALIELDKQI